MMILFYVLTMLAPKPFECEKTTQHFGREMKDSFACYRDATDRRVMSYIRAENRHTNAWKTSEKALLKQLTEELIARTPEDDESTPQAYGPYFYSRRFVKGLNYPRFERRKELHSKEVEVILDQNTEFKGRAFSDLGAFQVTRNGDEIFYTVDLKGNEQYTLFHRRLGKPGSRKSLEKDVSPDFEISPDGRFLYFIREDATRRPFQIWCRDLQSKRPAKLVYEERDPRFDAGLSRTKDDAFISIQLRSKRTSEIRLIEFSKDPYVSRTTLGRREDREYDLESNGKNLFIRTNERAPDFKILKSTWTRNRVSNTRSLIPHQKGNPIENWDVFAEHLVVLRRTRASLGLEVTPLVSRSRGLENQRSVRIVLPDLLSDISLSWNPELHSNSFRFSSSSFTNPGTEWEWSLTERKLKSLRSKASSTKLVSENYVIERLWVPSRDGEEIPVSLFYSKSVARKKPAPLLLRGYGAYGHSLDPGYSASLLALVDRGFIVGIAHIRGGGELGREWYESGKLSRKENTFYDFIDVSKALIQKKYTTPSQLGIEGGSAGGFLIGAVLNKEPNLFGAAILHVPFVDVLNTMLDESLPLTITEYEEWGNPNRKKDFERLYALSPYDQLKIASYPPTLVVSGFHDSRVMFWEPLKWVAKRRILKGDRGPLLLSMNLTAGHGGASGRYDKIRERALDLGFLVRMLERKTF